MDPTASAPAATLSDVLRDVIERMRRVSGADILSLYLYDADTRTYYAPVAVGLPEEGLLGAIADLQDQLARYLADAAQGKAPTPAELLPKHYGPNVWLTVTRRTLYAPDAPNEIDSSFIRRYHVESVVGLPLVAGDTLVGLLYLDFCAGPARRVGRARKPEALDAERLAELEREANRAALAIERARDAEERAALAAAGALAAQLGTPAPNGATDGAGLGQQLAGALATLLQTTGLRAAAVYGLPPGGERGRVVLVGQQGLPNAPAAIDAPEALASAVTPSASAAPTAGEPIEQTLAAEGLHLVAALPLRRADAVHGWLFLLADDRLALARRTPATGLLLQTVADLITGALVSQGLIATLEETNRVLGALSRMSSALLQPGASRQQVLDAVARHLTDVQVPEFAFQFATVFLLDEVAGHAAGPDTLVVRMAAGSATAEGIDAAPLDDARSNGRGPARVPRWAQLTDRILSPGDVLAYVARHRQTVVLGAVPPSADAGADEIVTGYPTEQLHRRTVPAIRADGANVATVPAVLIDPSGTAGPEPPQVPFTLDGDIFASSDHRDLVRVFVPFGLDPQARATGVLEAGYHRADRGRLGRAQVEALRAGAAQIAVATETARLYEDVKRHAEQLEITTDVSRALASAIDLDQTLRLVAKNLTRLVDASLCQIALYEEDGTGWHGAAASEEEDQWRRQRGERPEVSFLFDVFDRRSPVTIDDAQNSDLINPYYARRFGIRSLLALPLIADDQPMGVAILAQRERPRRFTAEEVQRTLGLAYQAAVAIKNARLHARSEEEHHIQKDVVVLGFGEWGRKAYQHLVALKQFYNFKTHVVVPYRPGRDAEYAEREQEVVGHGDVFYLDRPENPAHDQLKRTLESSCYVITYIATPAATHLPVLAEYYDLSNVAVIEKPLGAPPEAYREFLDSVDGSVEIVAADHYYFKLEVRLLQLLLTEERTLRGFIDSMEEIELELLEERPLTGAAADIGIIADMVPHAFAIISLFTPIDRIRLAEEPNPILLGRQEPLQGEKETYARLVFAFPHQERTVRLVITVGKGIENAKWIKLHGEQRFGGRRSFYKFDFGRGEAIDGTQTNLRAAQRSIREPGVPDTAHLTMMRHVLEKRHPAVGILAIREAMRSNQRIQELEAAAADLLARGEWTPYTQGQRPEFPAARPLRWPHDTAEEAAAEPALSRAD